MMQKAHDEARKIKFQQLCWRTFSSLRAQKIYYCTKYKYKILCEPVYFMLLQSAFFFLHRRSTFTLSSLFITVNVVLLRPFVCNSLAEVHILHSLTLLLLCALAAFVGASYNLYLSIYIIYCFIFRYIKALFFQKKIPFGHKQNCI